MLAAARRAFEERGYGESSMDDIAAAAGITKPMLYAYFGSKEGLYVACQAAAGEQLRESVTSAAAARDLPADERLWRGLLAVFTFIEEHREAWAIYHPPEGGSAGGVIGTRAAHATESMAELLGELLKGSGRAEGLAPEAAAHAVPLAHALTAATMAMAAWWLRHPEEPKELQALRLMNLVWSGFGDLLEGRPWLPRS
jgi:AcrR family transcriptional regulator